MKKQITQIELEHLARELIGVEFRSLSPRRKKIIQLIAEGELVSTDPNRIYKEQLTLGEQLADKVACFGGSWGFILFAVFILILWIIINASSLLFDKPFDPYPFILLNLGLSMLAALQAPFIMMSQNRRAEKDRIDANANYEVCLKMELDIKHLHKKVEEIESRFIK